jgi:hypothetical protein
MTAAVIVFSLVVAGCVALIVRAALQAHRYTDVEDMPGSPGETRQWQPLMVPRPAEHQEPVKQFGLRTAR